MKPITEKLLHKIAESHAGGFGVRLQWDAIFDTEQELIDAMFHEKVYTDEDNVPSYKWCKGYEFIRSLKKYYLAHSCLTEAQMRQLKRLAAELAYCIFCTKG